MREGFLQVLLLPVRLVLRPLRLLGRGLGQLGLLLRHWLARCARLVARRLLAPPWQFLGRLGLALRRLLAASGRLLWRQLLRPPLRLLARAGRFLCQRLLGPPWRFLGRLGLALRNILRLLWRPVRFMLMPWWLLYRRYLHPVVVRLLRTLFKLPVGAAQRYMVQPWQRSWHKSQMRRAQLRREWRSQLLIWRARARVALLRPQPPRKAIVAPVVPRMAAPPVRPRRATRLVTTGLAIASVAIASVITAQQAPRLRGAAAENEYQISSSKFVTVTATSPAPTATPTPQPSPTPWPTPDPLDGGGSVAFALRQHGNSDLYALSIGQSQPVRLTDHPAGDRDPAWSPDGTEIAFSSRRDGNWEVYILRLSDGDVRRMTHDAAFDGGPSWSPDGQWLVFESYRGGSLDLYLMSSDGDQGPIRLTQHPAPDFSPVWSPGGRHVAFTSYRSGNKDIYILSLDDAADGAAYNVTNTPDQSEDNPSFSPDGAYLAYDDDSSGRRLVYALPLADYRPVGEPITHGQGYHPTWSPDGKALSFIHNSAGQHHLIASSLDAWSVAPQSFSTSAQLEQPNWSEHRLPKPLPERLLDISQAPSPPLFVENVAPAAAEGAPYLLRELPVNAPAPYLSDRVDESFQALRQRVALEAGWDFLGEVDLLYEGLAAQPLPGQSNQTWNKAGRAFDYLSDYALSFDPLVILVAQRQEASTYWRTYLKTAAQDGTQGEPLRELPWDFRARFGPEPRYYDQGGRLQEQIPAGYYVDFTALAADYGWTWSPASDNWRTYFPGIRYWHYENRQGLNWEQAMLELYTAEEILSVFRR
jgi:TolB protein